MEFCLKKWWKKQQCFCCFRWWWRKSEKWEMYWKHKKGLNTEIQHKTYSSLSIYYSGFRKHTNFTISTLAPDFDTDKLLGWVQETRMSEENEKLCVLAPIALNSWGCMLRRCHWVSVDFRPKPIYRLVMSLCYDTFSFLAVSLSSIYLYFASLLRIPFVLVWRKLSLRMPGSFKGSAQLCSGAKARPSIHDSRVVSSSSPPQPIHLLQQLGPEPPYGRRT